MARTLDPLVVALIRTLNSRHRDWQDWELVQMFGASAAPLAEALREAISEEVTRQLQERQQ